MPLGAVEWTGKRVEMTAINVGKGKITSQLLGAWEGAEDAIEQNRNKLIHRIRVSRNKRWGRLRVLSPQKSCARARS